ncbi:MAG: hypothetical protein ACHQU1_03965 [Gemmatimonadales bacterium]
MDLFDLLFIVLFLAAVGVLISCAVTAATGGRPRAIRRLLRLAVGVATYMAVVAVSSLAAPQRVLAMGENDCSDDWCLAVMSASRSGGPATDTVTVVFRASSRARRVAQRERFVAVYVKAEGGRRYDALERGDDRPFDAVLQPGETSLITRVFPVDKRASGLRVVLTREGQIWFPGCCVIGEGIFHKPPVVRIS